MLTDEQIQMLNALISDSEIENIISSTPNGKSPGPDGLPNECYKIFSSILSLYLNAVFTKVIQTSSFLPEMLKAQVVILPWFMQNTCLNV